MAFVDIHIQPPGVWYMGQNLLFDAYCPYQTMEISQETYGAKGTQCQKKAGRKKPVAKPGTPPNDLSAISYATDDVIGKTKIVYLEDPEVVRKTPTRSEPMKKSP